MMLSAMYENGGNTLHRLLDGHPELFVYPFESQLGNSLLHDWLSSLFPFKYRWPEFPASGAPGEDYELFFDEEMKVRLRTPQVSKFRDADLQLDESERKRLFVDLLKDSPRSRANIIAAFFQATFQSWANLNRSGRERLYVGYSPIIGVDAERLLADFPEAHIVHVVRNPFSAYRETKRRPFPLSLHRYVWTWNIVQHMAYTLSRRFPASFHLVRYEDLVGDTRSCLSSLCQKLGISFSHSLLYPSWNGKKLDNVYPWGTIRKPTTETNREAIRDLTREEREMILSLSSLMLKALGYEDLPLE